MTRAHGARTARLVWLAAILALAGCAQMGDVSTQLTGGTPGSSTAGSDIRPADRLCASLDESYEVTDNIWRAMLAGGSQGLIAWQRNGFQMTGAGRREVEAAVKEVSKRHLWMPVVIEKQIGAYLHDEYPKDKIIARDGGRRADRRNYERADRALAAAAKDYTKLPYELKLFIVESDRINAEALPAGYIYVTRKAAADLDDQTLKLILGHEVAHIAKRHTSKQIQQRIVDTGMGVDMLKQVIENRGTGVDRKMLASWNFIPHLQALFARYDQDQELQADACSIRGLVYAGEDPIVARKEYLRMRGSEKKPAHSAARPGVPTPFALSFTEHPDDDARDRFFQEATSFHRIQAQRPTPTHANAVVAQSSAAEAKPAPAACQNIPVERLVRNDAEPLFTKLSAADRRKLQAAVCLKGAEVDGAWGPRTKHSVKQYECRTGREPSGALTPALVAELLQIGADEVEKRCR